MTDTETVIGNPGLHFSRQTEQTQGVRHRRAAAAHFFGDLFLGEFELRGKLLVGPRFFNRVEVFALQVFDERNFQHFLIIRFPHDGGNRCQPRLPCCPPAAFTRN